MSGQRFQTYFGVSIPPWKEKRLGAGAITIKFVLTGNIISKKNNEQAIAVRRHARKYLNDVARSSSDGKITLADAQKAIGMVYSKMRGNTQYAAFLAKMKPVIAEQMRFWIDRLQVKGLIFPLPASSILIRLYIKDRYRRDSINAQQTIQDLLKDCGVIFDDDDLHINPSSAAAARYVDELIHNIAVVSLTFMLDRKNNNK